MAAQIVLLCTLSACAQAPAAINPVSWWHDLEGGPIAQQRRAPPGATAPYPNLANVPTKPTFLPAPERARISAALLADRTRTEQQAVLEPLPNPQTPGAPTNATSAQPVAPATASPAAQPAASASFPAATRPPAAPPPAAMPPPEPATVQAATATLPSVPLAPPPPPTLAGIGLPGPPPPPFTASPQAGLEIRFAPGSIALGRSDHTRLAALAHRRGDQALAVIGFGDARESDPAAQAAALRLGLARAETVAAALAQNGVPVSALRLGAQASGAGALVELVQ
ncbi:MAG: hypothetical protein ACREFP_00800 [Acetobacteraceae bacterium]